MEIFLFTLGIILAFFLIRSMWRAYTDPSHVLGRQAANMNWVAIGRHTDNDGYKNVKLARDGMEVVISFQNENVELVKPQREEPFNDFVELERWLANEEKFLNEEEEEEEEETDDYHPNLDKAVNETTAFLKRNKMYIPLRGNGTDINITSELFVYIASYLAMLNSGENMYAMGWNTFKSSIANRIKIEILDNPPPLSGSTKTQKHKTLVHYVSEYFTEMSHMEDLLLNNKKESGEIELQTLVSYLLNTLGSNNPDHLSQLQAYLTEVSEFASRKIVPKVIRVFG